jgi:hypothetical protein
MQTFLKIVLPVALIATALGTVAGYALHRQPTESLQRCNLTGEPGQSSTVREGGSTQQESSMDFSWRRWPSLTDF